MVDACFGDKESLTLKEFQEISESKSSDMLITILELLKNRLPCSENFYHFQQSYIDKMREEGKEVGTKKTKKLANQMMRSISPKAGSRRSSGDEASSSAMGAASMLSKMTDKVDLDKFKSRAEERKRRAEATDATISSADPDSPSMHADQDFVRLANKKGAGGNSFASPSHILNPGAARSGEETKVEKV